MCNINLLIKKKQTKDNITHFLNCVSAVSYNSNEDGDGLYFDTHLIKGLHKIDVSLYRNKIEKSSDNVFISFQRLATHGLNEFSTQPFLSKTHNLAFVHNGILSDYANDNKKDKKNKHKSDSYNFFIKFLSVFKNKTNPLREENIKDTLKDLLDTETNGFFSIVIYDSLEKNIYYVKSFTTSMYIYENSNYTYMTTNKDNEVFLNILKGKFKVSQLKEDIIYKMDTQKGFKFKEIDKLKEGIKKVETISFNSDIKHNSRKGLSYSYDFGFNNSDLKEWNDSFNHYDNIGMTKSQIKKKLLKDNVFLHSNVLEVKNLSLFGVEELLRDFKEFTMVKSERGYKLFYYSADYDKLRKAYRGVLKYLIDYYEEFFLNESNLTQI